MDVCIELYTCPYEFTFVIYLTLSPTCCIILGKPHYIFGLQFADLKNERLGKVISQEHKFLWAGPLGEHNSTA